MTELLLSIDPAVVSLLVFVWAWAGRRAVGLPYAANARTLRRRTGGLMVLTGLGLLLVLVRAALVVELGQSGWWFVQEKVVLALPLLVVPSFAVVGLALPRLLRLRRAARAFPDVVPPSLRQEAAHPLIGWPVQLAALGSLAGLIVVFFVSYPATAGSSFAVSTGVGLAAVVSWQLLRTRHARFGGEVMFPSRWSRLARSAIVVACVATAAVLGPLAALAVAAPPSDAHADAGHGSLDLGGGVAPSLGQGRETGVNEIREQSTGGPVRQFTLEAQHTRVSDVDALTYNGTLPGPELRVQEGDLVEVILHNRDIAEGVTVHWHGYDLPNGDDGVAGVTQDAVKVGGAFTYRFRADQVGTFWYHSHQQSNAQVTSGLYGVLVVSPASTVDGLDLAVPFHRLHSGPAMLMGSTVDITRPVAPATPVRLRLVNAANDAVRFDLRGASARVAAVDGTDLVGPTLVANPSLSIAAGGRVDLTFAMPSTPVGLEFGSGPSLTLGSGPMTSTEESTEVDLLHYGTPAATPFGSHFDRHFTVVLDQKVARLSGVPTMAYTVNGNAYPEIPSQFVRYGDLVKFTIVARGYEAHPMHPHGHHVLVLSRNGVRATGSPLWMDTFEVRPGEVWEVALRADNPGLWMDHCHNLRHAAEGMVFHLVYEGITTPYRMTLPNHPE